MVVGGTATIEGSAAITAAPHTIESLFMTYPLPSLNASQEALLPADWPAIETELACFTESFPLLALLAVLRQPEAYAPYLVDELTECLGDTAKRIDADEARMLHLYAMHLLAALRDARGFQPLLQIARLDGETLEELLGDHLTEGLPRALAATCPGDEAALQALAADRSVYFWSRSAALRALALRTLEGDYPRSELLAWLEQEAGGEAERMVDEGLQPEQGTDSDYLSELVVTMEEIGAGELLPAVSEWFDDGLVESSFNKLDETSKRLQRDWQTCRTEELAHGWGYPRDILAEIGRWACFQPDEDSDDDESSGGPSVRPPSARRPRSAAMTPALAAAEKNTRSAAALDRVSTYRHRDCGTDRSPSYVHRGCAWNYSPTMPCSQRWKPALPLKASIRPLTRSRWLGICASAIPAGH
ncbi:DUF1186 domain-containing protein [Chitinimonas arctica]|uniref:DUF1186 domain-containing protein n=1 Tax=Chitinimonas arctica TaxID=2594795 RepID=A0A516SG19_9NEIS|nr:DUF1186 domain-containing protein [Chitinimonas arctica]